MASRTGIFPKDAPTPAGPYSTGLVVDNLVFVSGQIGKDPASGKLVDSTFEAEAKQTFDNISVILKASGASWCDVAKTSVILKDWKDFEAMNKVYDSFLTGCQFKPARTTIQGGAMPANSRIEVDVIAVKKP